MNERNERLLADEWAVFDVTPLTHNRHTWKPFYVANGTLVEGCRCGLTRRAGEPA